MADITPFDPSEKFKNRSFWKRPEGVTGAILGIGLLAGLGYGFYLIQDTLLLLAENTLYLSLMIGALAGIAYMILDPRMRSLVWYGYKSVMRSITSVFVNIDPIGILKSYVSDLKDNLRKMSKQIGELRGQMRRLKGMIDKNGREIERNLKTAGKAREKNDRKQLTLATRKAARLRETNEKYKALHAKMDVLYKILSKMYQNSEILYEDTRDQVRLKEEERKAIRASHSAMRSAMATINGNGDKRAMFDMAVEAIAEDVANKVGEMERFMEMSANFMDSVDLQNGVFEEEGIKMLEQWEARTEEMLLTDPERARLGSGVAKDDTLDLDSPRRADARVKVERRDDKSSTSSSDYESLFD